MARLTANDERNQRANTMRCLRMLRTGGEHKRRDLFNDYRTSKSMPKWQRRVLDGLMDEGVIEAVGAVNHRNRRYTMRTDMGGTYQTAADRLYELELSKDALASLLWGKAPPAFPEPEQQQQGPESGQLDALIQLVSALTQGVVEASGLIVEINIKLDLVMAELGVSDADNRQHAAAGPPVEDGEQ